MNRCAHCYGDLPDFAVFCPHCAHAYEPDFGRMLNQTIGERYRLYRRLGQGGLSTVFAATDLQTDDVVVVKVSDPAQLVQRELSYAIDAEAARNYWGEMLERMRREAETLAAIDHPNIVQFYDTGLIGDDLRFVVMEFLRGRMLRDELDAKGRLEPAAAIRIALEICEALREVHARGIVHRDISPRNVMLYDEVGETGRRGDREKGRFGKDESPPVPRSPSPPVLRAKLIDFGIAKFPQPSGAPPFNARAAKWIIVRTFIRWAWCFTKW
jgi:serine/threonine protein kinase